MQYCELSLDALILSVRLGWAEDERAMPQPVSIQCQFRFLQAPTACFSDRLDDTLCYDSLSQMIAAFCEVREFRLIEYLAHELYELIKTHHDNVQCRLRISKTPAMKHLDGNASFEISDW